MNMTRPQRTTQNKVAGTSRQIYISKDGTYLERANFYLKPEIWAFIEELARMHNLPVSRYIEFLISAEAKRQSLSRKGVAQ